MGDIGTFTKGNGILKSDFTEKGVPCMHYGQIHTSFNTVALKNISFISEKLAKKCRKAKTGDLIIASTSEDVQACCKAVAWLGNYEIAVSGDAHIFSHNQNPKYVAYLFQTEMFQRQKRLYATGTKVIRVKSESLEKFCFPFPPKEEQERIVKILDRFESLVNDLSQGLPAEIATVQQQYEYYRNKLLTFEKIA
ncbi:MAG: restriction endonuclease subunit S [Paludibacteraceae bacterium]